jgi:hypothetical protein
LKTCWLAHALRHINEPAVKLAQSDWATWSEETGDDMAEGMKLTGTCLCGAVKVAANANKPMVAVCHCEMCRRWSSGPFMEVDCQQVVFEGEENIRRIRSSEWAERGFCTRCGSNLFLSDHWSQ